MEYLKSINDELKKINESNIQYLNLFNHPSIVYGITDKTKVDFHKFPKKIEDDIHKKFGGKTLYFLQYHNTSTNGNRIRFKTTSRRLILKVQLKRGHSYKNMVLWNSSGIDINIVDRKGNYKNHKLIAPLGKNRIFAEEVWLPANSFVCIFLPNYDTIEKMYIGIQTGSRIAKYPYKKNKRSPIIFYGNGMTQGASATKSGNSYPNIVSKKLNQDIIDLSTFNGCKATQLIAEHIGKLECDSIILDYSRDASSVDELKKHHEPFYKTLRKFHPDKKIIIMTTVNFNDDKKYEDFDDVIIETYENAVKRGENVALLNQNELFRDENKDIVTVDACSFNDLGMFIIANKICELLKK